VNKYKFSSPGYCIQIIFEFFLVLFWLLIVPIMIGTLVINQLFKEKVTDFLLASICGVICMLAFFYVLVTPYVWAISSSQSEGVDVDITILLVWL